MSHQTGISPNEDLLQIFASCESGESRLLLISITDETLRSEKTLPIGDPSWEKDWDTLVPDAFQERKPLYGLYRKDINEWILISWSPDDASVRDKMLFASTKATLKKHFGGGRICDELCANVKSDITYKAYQNHVQSENLPGPLSMEEKSREEVKIASSASTDINSRCETMKGLSFPFSTQLQESLITYRAGGEENYIQMSINVEEELLNLETIKENCALEDLPKLIPSDGPRYHLYRFKHTHEGEYKDVSVFVYTLPNQDCSIKERMLYSSCINALVNAIQAMDIQIIKKIQAESGSELTREYLMDELYPKQNLHQPKFSRPPPPHRGNRRMVKAPPSLQ